MCGIVGYVGERRAAPVILDGLRRLEYRGYDSAGLAVLAGDHVDTVRRVGHVAALLAAVPPELEGTTAIGHTRWATHGGVTEANAHPHLDATNRIALAHNGIIENHTTLRARLEEEGFKFRSETDTEVLVHLVHKFYTGDPEAAVKTALGLVQGTYGIAVIFAEHPGVIIAARNGSPLVVGKGNGETFLASDPHALSAHTREVVYLEDRDIVRIEANGWTISRMDGGGVSRNVEVLGEEWAEEGRGDFSHHMLKEIHEQPESLARCLRGRVVPELGGARLGGLELSPRDIASIRHITVLGCGTSFHAGLVGAAAMEGLARIPASAEIASEFRYRNPVIGPDDLFFAVSQSGETADTLGAVKEVQVKGGRVFGVVNVVGSSIARTCGHGVYVHSGPEIAVASTKAFTSQVAAMLVAALSFARTRALGPHEGKAFGDELLAIPERVGEWLASEPRSVMDAVDLCSKGRFVFFLGRGVSHAVALEGALKLKEIAYVPCMAYPAAEMKHGPIALIDKGTPVIVIVPDDVMRDKTLSTIQEVKARGARVIVVHTAGDTHAAKVADISIPVPRASTLISPLLSVLPLQLLAYRAGLALGRDIDRPRNLAKSVTVE
ncbi:glutamine--fructose-6-phosphate aminotransferase [isomerizing] [Deltaproteobacteria bacterium]|nr:glutamine--fructose-6-phosphate aminotransferase [isomerizing] [Deltaproteobacteria bacterium]